MKYLPNNTLAHFNAAYQTRSHNFAELPTKVFAEATKEYRKACLLGNPVSPDDDAVTFYTLNHAASIVRKAFTPNEPLPDWARAIMMAYTDAAMSQGERLLHYVLLITVREMRHLNSHGHPTPAFWAKVAKEFGSEMETFIKLVASHGGEETAMGKYLNEPPQVSVETYLKAMSYAFHNSPGWNSEHESYGGPKWGRVTDAALAMLTGVTSMEMLVDTGYTLAHNGGPIFNKTEVKIYHSYHVIHFMTVLDVQRAGQMMDLMMVADTLGVKKTAEAVAAVELIKAHCPLDANGKPTLKGYVDWQLVSDLRPDKEKQDSPNKYIKVAAKPVVKPKTMKPKTAKPVAPPLTHVHGKKVTVTGQWQVYPNQTVTSYERTEK